MLRTNEISFAEEKKLSLRLFTCERTIESFSFFFSLFFSLFSFSFVGVLTKLTTFNLLFGAYFNDRLAGHEVFLFSCPFVCVSFLLLLLLLS